MGEQPKISAAASSFFALRLAGGSGGAAELHQHARELLLCVNALELPTAPEWGVLHEQGEQSGAARIDDVAAARVRHAVWRASKAGKTTKLLGRSFLAAVWADHVAPLLLPDGGAEAGEAEAGEDEALQRRREFFGAFEAELLCAEADDSLVWSTDVDAALKRQQAKRAGEAQQRLAGTGEAVGTHTALAGLTLAAAAK